MYDLRSPCCMNGSIINGLLSLVSTPDMDSTCWCEKPLIRADSLINVTTSSLVHDIPDKEFIQIYYIITTYYITSNLQKLHIIQHQTFKNYTLYINIQKLHIIQHQTFKNYTLYINIKKLHIIQHQTFKNYTLYINIKKLHIIQHQTFKNYTLYINIKKLHNTTSNIQKLHIIHKL